MGSITDGVIETDQHPERFRVGGVFRRDVGSADESAKGRPGSATFGRLTSAPTRRRRVHRLRFDVKDPRRFSRRSKSRASRRCALAFAPVRTRSFSSVAARVICPLSRSSPRSRATRVRGSRDRRFGRARAALPRPRTPRTVRALARRSASLGVARGALTGASIYARALSFSLALGIWAIPPPRRARSDPRDLSEPSPRRRGTRGRTPRAPSPLTRDRRQTHVR